MNRLMLINILLASACLAIVSNLRKPASDAHLRLSALKPAQQSEGVALHELPENAEYRSDAEIKDIYNYDLFSPLRGEKPKEVKMESAEPEKVRPPEPDWKGIILRGTSRFGDVHVAVIQLEIEPPKPTSSRSSSRNRGSSREQQKSKEEQRKALLGTQKILERGEKFEWKGRELTLKEIGSNTVVLSADGDWEHELLQGLDEQKRISIYEDLLAEMAKSRPKPKNEKSEKKDKKAQQQAAAIAEALKRTQEQLKQQQQQQQNNNRNNNNNRGGRGGRGGRGF